jgi:nicotinate-nucleotide adenylyltransferase
MNRLGIFGGSFDPPHLGHLQVARQAANELELDKVYWIPAKVSPHKLAENTTPSRFRVDMVRLMTQLDDRFVVDTREIEREGPSFTFKTLEDLGIEFPKSELYLIVGEDSCQSLPTWKRADRIRELAQLVVYKRVNPSQRVRAEALLNQDYWLKGLPIDVTSTEIRHLTAKKLNVDHLLTPEVAAYIKDEGLFQI